LLLRNWRLTLLQFFPAAWIGVMTWNMKNHLLSRPTFSTSDIIPVAVGVVLAAQIAYWCNATFAYTMTQSPTADIRAAFGEARRHWRLVGGLAALTGGFRRRSGWRCRACRPTGSGSLVAMFVCRSISSSRFPLILGVRKTALAARTDDP
jgi:peptidoglycan/LPS O-acetylase OafA/YrhL